MKLSIKGFALAAGIVWGMAVFVMTLSTVWRGGGEHLYLLSGIYYGYRVTYLGSLAGLLYGFASAALAGGLFAWLHNRF